MMPSSGASRAQRVVEERMRHRNNIYMAYERYDSYVKPLRYDSRGHTEQREYLFDHVKSVRHKSLFGSKLFVFHDRKYTVYGPYDDEETCYAAWLLYMETTDDAE